MVGERIGLIGIGALSPAVAVTGLPAGAGAGMEDSEFNIWIEECGGWICRPGELGRGEIIAGPSLQAAQMIGMPVARRRAREFSRLGIACRPGLRQAHGWTENFMYDCSLP